MILIQTSVNFVLLFQDDFTGADLPEDGFQFWVNGRAFCPLKKPEGFYVFVGLTGKSWTLTVKGTHFIPRTVTLCRDTLDPHNPIAILRLFRRGDLHFSDCALLRGHHRPGETVIALCPDTPPLKLRTLEAPTDGGPSRLTFMGYTPRVLTRHRFCMGTGASRELFVITARDQSGGYLSDRHFLHRHKEGEPILRAYGSICDTQGQFSIPIEEELKDTLQSIESYSEEVRQWGCLLQTAPN
ncbi:MAG: hypothetical protein RR135_00845 [Oscillospiraceae bacterium]